MASRFVTHKLSSMSVNQKYNILTQQCFTRIHNTSENISDEVKVNILNEFMEDMALSGYNESDRLKVLRGAFKTHINLKHEERIGLRPYFRSKSFQKNERTSRKLNKKTKWFKNAENKYKTVMFVDSTPGDKLLKKLRETEQKHKISESMRIKFVSKSGIKLINKFEKKDPFQKPCDSVKCKPCDPTNEGKREFSNCRSNNISYMAKCIYKQLPA